MRNLARLATAAAAITFMSLPATFVLAQNAPAAGKETSTAPATAPAPAAMTAAPAAAKPANTTTEPAAEPKKTKVRKMASHKSVDSCPWSNPRHRKEYEHCVPFDKLW